MATKRHATLNLFICIALSLLMPIVNDAAKLYEDDRSLNDDSGIKLTREYHLRQGALRGMIVKPYRNFLQPVEVFLGIPYAAPPVKGLRFMPPVSAPIWSGVKRAIHFAPVCPQSIPMKKKVNPPSLGRQEYMMRLRPFLENESEDCLYLNIYVPYREQKPKKFPVLVFIHGDSYEWSSGNPYDGTNLASYGNIMVITINYRLGILGFMKPSITDHDLGNNGLLDQLAALNWIKDNIEDLNGDPRSVTLMGHGTGAACVSLLMLAPIPEIEKLFHRAILMSGSALSDWAMTKDPTQYTLQAAQILGCNLTSASLMQCLQSKPLSEIKKVQILAREFETRLGPFVAGYFFPSEPAKMMMSYPDLLKKYQLLAGVTELESYHDFGVLELNHGILDNQRDDLITKYAKKVLEGAENNVLKEILKEYAPTKLDPQRWSVENNRDVILDIFSDVRTVTPMINFAKYHAKYNRQCYFYVFGHNSVSSQFDQVKSVHGEELPYVLGVPLGGAKTHLHSKYTPEEILLSEVIMRLWTNFVKMGTPNTQSVNEYFTTQNKKLWHQYNVEWPEYNNQHQSYLRFDLPPKVGSYYRSNYTDFWTELPNKMRKYLVDPLYEYTPVHLTTTHRPRTTHRSSIDTVRQIWSNSRSVNPPPRYNAPSYGRVNSNPSPSQYNPDTDIYRQIMAIKTPSRPPPRLMEYTTERATEKPKALPTKISSTTITLVVTLAIIFVATNVAICSTLYYKKRKQKLRQHAIKSRQSKAESGEVDVIGQKSAKNDNNPLKTLKNGCSVIKSMSINKINNGKKSKKKSEVCKTPKSDDSGGFRQRFELRRHLSTSTLDAHTKVKDWIANEVMHRCAPNILRTSNSDLNTEKKLTEVKPYTRSEEILSDTKNSKKSTLNVESEKSKTLQSKISSKSKTSEKTTSTSALGSHSSIESMKQSFNSAKRTAISKDSFKSKSAESVKSKKVSVAVDATPAARTNSILNQEPIEVTKSFDCTDNKIHSIDFDQIKQFEPEKSSDANIIEIKSENKTNAQKIFTNEVTLSLDRNKPLKISHKHSTSDPVTDINYEMLKEKIEMSTQVEIPPPVTFRNDVNVTSRDETSQSQFLSAADALLAIQKRNYPKVLPDLPKTQKRLSLQPTSLQTFRSYVDSAESQSDRSKVPPAPPPRTTTLERRLAYKNSKPLSSFDTSNPKNVIEESMRKNYENIDSISPLPDTRNRSFDSLSTKPDPIIIIPAADTHRDYPKVIIPSSPESKIFIHPSSSQTEIPANIARVRLPEDFHSHTSSITSFSSFCSDDADDDFDEDTLIKELVGGVESPTSLDELDSKGPDSIFEKKLEIVPVKLNPGQIVPKSKEDYVCVSNLYLPDISSIEQTAQIKPNFGLNKLQHRSESIHRPPEKAVKIKTKRFVKPTILKKSSKGAKRGKDKNSDIKLEHSTSGSSNDTENSTGTVREVRKE